MKKAILFGLAGLCLSAIAATPQGDVMQVESGVSKVTVSTAEARKHAKVASGLKMKHYDKAKLGDNKVRPLSRKAPVKAGELPVGISWQESFEGCDPSVEGWLPEGWSVISNSDPTLTQADKWNVIAHDPTGFVPAPPDGDYNAYINFNSLFLDEALVTPALNISANEQLFFSLYTAPVFFFDIYSGNVDWDTMEWIDTPVALGDVTIEVRENGGEWQKVWSLVDKYKDMSFSDLMYVDGYIEYTVNLSAYAGKTVEFAVHYVANDCNSVAIDNFKVGLPNLTGVKYSEPYEALYFGSQSDANWTMLNSPFSIYPVNTPLTFENTSTCEGAVYAWDFHDPATNNWGVSNEQDALTVTYHPDYSSEFTCRNNMYYNPVLRASAQGATDGSFTVDAAYLQAGGRADFEINNGMNTEMYHFGMLPFNVATTELGVTVIDDETIGDSAIPVFGHNVNSDRWWLNFKTQGDPSEGDDVKVTALLNFMAAPAAPLVIEGVDMLALGQIEESDAIEFSLDIIPLSEDYEPLETPLASAKLKANQILRGETTGVNTPFTFAFKFDQPVVLDDSYTAYYVRFSGFNADGVTYFVPVQSQKPDETRFHGYVESQNKILSDEYRRSFTPMAYVDGPEGPCYNSFALNLQGFYPWLDCDVEEVEIDALGTEVKVPMGSYYAGSELTVEAPVGVEASVAGRYGDCVLSVRHDDTEVIADGVLKVSAPGVEKTITIKQKENSGIDSIEAAANNGTVTAVYTLDGRRVQTDGLKDGIYLLRMSNGSTRKVVIK